MPVTKQSIVKELRSIESDLLQRKEQVDYELDAIRVTISVIESRPEKTRERSSFVTNVTEAICQLLREEGPLHRDAICKRIQKKGLHIGGEKPVATIGTYLSKDKRFKNVSRGMWALEDEGPIGDLAMENGHDESVTSLSRF